MLVKRTRFTHTPNHQHQLKILYSLRLLTQYGLVEINGGEVFINKKKKKNIKTYDQHYWISLILIKIANKCVDKYFPQNNLGPCHEYLIRFSSSTPYTK